MPKARRILLCEEYIRRFGSREEPRRMCSRDDRFLIATFCTIERVGRRGCQSLEDSSGTLGRSSDRFASRQLPAVPHVECRFYELSNFPDIELVIGPVDDGFGM